MDRAAAGHQGPARVRSGAPVEPGGVAGDDCHVGGIAAERVGRDLRERRAMPLPLRGEPGGDQDLAARLDADVGALVGPDAGPLDVAADPEPEPASGRAPLGLRAPELRGADRRQRNLQTGRIVAAVVARGRAVLEREADVPGKLVRLDEVPAAYLGRLEAELTGDEADHP